LVLHEEVAMDLEVSDRARQAIEARGGVVAVDFLPPVG
jgi:ribosomal protein L15